MNKDGKITISEGATLFVNGNIINTGNNKFNIRNGGSIYVTGNIQNNGDSLFYSSSSNNSGEIILIGKSPQVIGGIQKTFFNNLSLQNNASLSRSIDLYGSLNLSKSSLFLDTCELQLYYKPSHYYNLHGRIIAETDSSRIYGEKGTIGAYENIKGSCANIGGTGISLDGVLGYTQVHRGHASQPKAGEGSIYKFFDIKPQYASGAKIKIDYLNADFDSLQTNEKNFKIWVSPNHGQNYTRLSSIVNAAINIVETTDDYSFTDNTNKRITTSSSDCKNPPKVFLGNDTDVCENSGFQLAVTISNKKAINYFYQWNDNEFLFNDTLQVDSTGIYWVCVTDENGCYSFDTVKISVNPLPKVNFSNTDNCVFDSLIFASRATIGNGSIAQYLWDFGDGTYADSPNVKKAYLTAGSYTIKHTVISDKECAATMEKVNIANVYPLPKANFDVSYVSENTVVFQDKTENDSYLISAKWVFDDTIVTGNPCKRTFDKMGNYNVTLVAVSQRGGCKDTIGQTITINPAGAANFTILNGCVGTPVTINNLSTEGAGKTCYFWNFGDGTISVEASPVKIYNKPGIYRVSLLVSNGLGWEESIAKSIEIFNKPFINFGDTISTCNSEYLLEPEQAGINYLWSDGSTKSSLLVTTNGLYAVTVTNANFCKNEESAIVLLNSAVNPRLGDSIRKCGRTLLDAHNPGGTYKWSTGANTRTIRITESGIYSVTVTDKYGCTGSGEADVNILPVIPVNLGNDTTFCSESMLVLEALPQGNNDVKYTWSDSSITRTLPVATTGLYWVKVNNQNGCISGDSIIVIVKTSPKVDLGPDKTFCTTLQNTLEANQPYAACYWYSEKGLETTGQYFTANDTGNFRLKAVLPNGCIDSDTIHFEEVAHSIIPMFLASSDARVGDTIQFTGLSYPEPDTYFWEFGDGATDNTLSPQHTYTFAGIFKVKLTVNNGSCDASVTKEITVEGYNKSNKIRPDSMYEKNKYKNISITSSRLYPNPNNGSFRYEIELGDISDLQITLFSSSGRLIDMKHLKNQKAYIIEYTLSDLPAGAYVFKAIAGKTKKTYKIIINK